MRVVRLLVLGTLAARGPMYGHQIRRIAEMINVEAWSEIRAGSLYHALHQLEAEGLIEAVRTEQRGRLPARTVYAVTAEGRTELSVLRDRGLREVHAPRDPFDVALWVAAGLPPEELEFTPGLLEFLEKASIAPGAKGEVTALSPDGTITVEMGGERVGVGAFAADRILATEGVNGA